MSDKRQVPKQQRGVEAEKRIVAAAHAIFAEKGYANARVSDIVKRSQTSTGSFYYRFKTKEALFDYMLELYMDKCREAISQLSSNLPDTLAELIFRAVCRNVELVEMNQGFYRAINEVSVTSPQVWSRLQLLSQELSEAIIEYAKPFQSEVKAPNYEQAIRQAVQLMSGWLANRASHNLNLRRNEEDATASMLYRAAMGVLEVHPVPDCSNIKK